MKKFLKILAVIVGITALGGTSLYFFGDEIREWFPESAQETFDVIHETVKETVDGAIETISTEKENVTPSPAPTPDLFGLYPEEKQYNGVSTVTPFITPSAGLAKPTSIPINDTLSDSDDELSTEESITFTVAKHHEVTVPTYTKDAQYIINDDKPFFNDTEKKNTEAFESYSALDSLKRCGVAYANICLELMPTEERGEIGSVKPSGWHTVKYNGLVDGNYLYNRCHLIGFQLAGENANEKNLITGTRYLNIQGMLDQENEIASYVKSTGNHVLYRVTPIFIGDELVCRGLVLEAWSVEDSGTGICFCRFGYNVQPGIKIDYMTGDSTLIG